LKQKIKSRLLQIFGKTISINNDAFKTDYLANVSNQQLLFEHMIDYSDFKNNLSYLNKIAKTAEVSWNLEDYTALNASFEYLSNKFLDEMQSSIKRDSTSIFSQISMYNEMISALEIIDGLNDTLNQTDIENFKEYLKNPRQMKNIDIEFWSLRARANIMFASLIDEGNILLKSEKEFLCLLKGACPPIQDYVIENNLKNNSQILAKICSEITALETAKNLSNYSIDNADAEKKQIILKNIQEYINNIKDTINSTAYLISPNLDTKCTFLTENFNLFQFGKNYLLDEITGNCQSPKGTNIGDFLSYPLSPESTDIYNFKDKYCGSFIKPTNLSAYKIPTIINSTPDFTLKLQELPPICCILGRCGICCSNCTKTYPIIFLHGHLFNKQNSPELALEIFSKMQEGLEKEGYINAGIILPNGENMSYGEWGLHGNPISVRATYYYAILNETGERIITLKSDKDISTYAERLNNIINVIKERTGKDKVILITHSMGGLVARKYIDKYGNNSISKLIMIAAPNQGISGTARDLCPLFGEQKECDDMTAGSEFILNLDPAVNGTYAYLISGVGCDTDGKDGDGVVKYTETKLENAREYEIRGKCNALDEIFHEEITNTDKYPEVYSIILKILKGDV
jgi:hypothetical protein